ncbi:hypothetical protein M433DRAFT_408815 [Acidomyces richmondensis BFW]|nr:MAG: hypothetical protein FE78DRAFT_214738 [Acidomyces sp. 'richmondensis']KYG42508.1 hypothetical protein M433DRAFT_408815 [Acidomyces richmondensis BFW]
MGCSGILGSSRAPMNTYADASSLTAWSPRSQAQVRRISVTEASMDNTACLPVQWFNGTVGFCHRADIEMVRASRVGKHTSPLGLYIVSLAVQGRL